MTSEPTMIQRTAAVSERRRRPVRADLGEASTDDQRRKGQDAADQRSLSGRCCRRSGTATGRASSRSTADPGGPSCGPGRAGLANASHAGNLAEVEEILHRRERSRAAVATASAAVRGADRRTASPRQSPSASHDGPRDGPALGAQTSRKRRIAMAEPMEPIAMPTMTTTTLVSRTSDPGHVHRGEDVARRLARPPRG